MAHAAHACAWPLRAHIRSAPPVTHAQDEHERDQWLRAVGAFLHTGIAEEQDDDVDHEAFAREAEEQAHAAAKMQAIHRGRLARGERKEQSAAAVKLQAASRGRLERAARRQEQRAATLMQAAERVRAERARERLHAPFFSAWMQKRSPRFPNPYGRRGPRPLTWPDETLLHPTHTRTPPISLRPAPSTALRAPRT